MKPTTGLLLAMFAVAGTAHGSHFVEARDGSYYTDAEVLDVQPIVRVVEVSEPRESCWNETVRREPRGYRSHTPVLLGGILGGVLGHQFGSGRGNDVMTVAGSLLGASIGRDAAHAHRVAAHPAYATERICEVTESVREEERIEGYRVRYRLDGREFVTRTGTDPGARLRVRVDVEPAPYN